MDVADSPGTASPPRTAQAGNHDRGVERARLAAVRRYDILDTPPDGAFDRIASLAARWFDVPVATVSIVDSDRIWLKAAHGLRAGLDLQRAPGLCASAIYHDETLVIPDTLADPEASSNPLVVGEMGFRFYAGAPIITSDGHRLGTVNVLDVTPRTITPEDAQALADLSAIVMDEMELRLSALRTLRAERELRAQIERDKAELEGFAATLRRTLLPPTLPQIPGLELASHYEPASARDVGGDFYDVFFLGEQRWGFFLGDVCGKGAGAAAVTSLIRHTLRAAALHDDDPVAVLEELNTALLLDIVHEGRFCTTVFGTITPASDGGFDVHLGTGGHPPPLALRATDGEEKILPHPVTCDGMLVGALPEARFARTTVHLRPGDGLLLYTDGVTDAHADGTDLLGQEGLVAYVSRLAAEATRHDGELSAKRLTRSLGVLLDGSIGTDDVAILAMSATPAR